MNRDVLSSCGMIKFVDTCPIDIFLAEHIADYEYRRHEVIGLNLRYSDGIKLIIYALDKAYLDKGEFIEGRLPVKQFTLSGMYFNKLLPYIEEMQFNVYVKGYCLEDMEIIHR